MVLDISSKGTELFNRAARATGLDKVGVNTAVDKAGEKIKDKAVKTFGTKDAKNKVKLKEQQKEISKLQNEKQVKENEKKIEQLKNPSDTTNKQQGSQRQGGFLKAVGNFLSGGEDKAKSSMDASVQSAQNSANSTMEETTNATQSNIVPHEPPVNDSDYLGSRKGDAFQERMNPRNRGAEYREKISNIGSPSQRAIPVRFANTGE